jgi:uncharacterized membrane protein
MTTGADAAPAPIAIDSVDPGCAVGWWARAAALFLLAPLRWVAWGLALMLAMAWLGQVPLVGVVVAAAITPALLGGWMLAARQLQRGGSLAWRDVLAGFRGAHARPLLALGAALAGVTLLIPLAASASGADAVMGAVAIDTAADTPAAVGRGMLVLLLLLVLSLIASAALWFAPALVVLRQTSAWQAARTSLRAVLDNGLTFLLYGIIQLLLAASASLLPWQAGWLVLLPVMLLTVYLSYEDVFGE